MPKPPFRKGLNPLFRAGLIDDVSGPFAKFLWFCKRNYLENQALKAYLHESGIDVQPIFQARRTKPGMPGPHRKVFDTWYEQMATDWQVRRAAQEQKGRSSKQRLN
jgi:hypothetical protein